MSSSENLSGTSSSSLSPESKPEQYLREIRDLHLQNNEILKKITDYEKKQVSTKRWGIFFGIFGVLLPYIFTAWLAWTFYTKVVESVDSLKTFVIELPENIGLGVSDSFQDFKDKNSQKIDSIQESLNTKKESVSDSLSEKWDNIFN